MTQIIPHWLTKQASLQPSQLAIETDKGEAITFETLQDKSEVMAQKLATFGVTKGNHVAILSTNKISMVIAIHALSYLGAVAVLLNTRLTREELIYQIKDAEVSQLLTCDHHEETAEKMNLNIPINSFVVIEQLKKKQVNLQTEINLEDHFTIIYTSGTTGFPKGVIHTYGNHFASAIGSALNLGLNDHDKWLASLPIFHVGGLSVFIRSVIYGMPVYLLEKFDEKIVHQAIMYEGVTIVSVVTVMLQRLIHLLENEKYPVGFRCMLLGGGPAPKSLLEEAKNLDIPVFQSYGMTETSSQIVTLNASSALTKIGSAGKPLFTAQLKIHEPDAEAIGEIYVKGPMVTKGYFNNQKATKSSFQDGWLATGDLGYVDEEGFVYVVDRRSDLIISGGENVYPAEIEAVLTAMTAITEVGVIGVDDDVWGQIPVAVIVKNNPSLTKEEVITYARGKLAAYKIPKKIYFIDKLPRNATNKLMRRALLNMIN